MYDLNVDAHFAAAHCLIKYPGKCADMHGHTWGVTATVRAEDLDEIGMCLDFKKIARALDEVVDRFDHRSLNDMPEFAEINPTAENISRIIFDDLSQRIDTDQARVVAVTVRESDRYRVTYSRTSADV